jgi:dehydrogenase/reductase SDR family protein 1
MFSAGVRAHYRATQLAAPGMIARRRGLIVNVSHWAAQKRIGNVAYGVSKAATDKMTADMAIELQPHGVTVVSIAKDYGFTDIDGTSPRALTLADV